MRRVDRRSLSSSGTTRATGTPRSVMTSSCPGFDEPKVLAQREP